MIPKEYKKETMAKVVGRALPISTRHAIEICNYIRGKNTQKMISFLESVMKKEKVVPFKRFDKGVGHKAGIAAGRYPIKASSEILKLLKSAEANAQFKALNTSNLVIGHISANKSSMAWHFGRQRRRRMKRTHVEIILTEKESKKGDKKDVKKVEEKKPEAKKDEVKKEVKQEDSKK